MFCISCGAQNPSEAKFCFKCGEKIISDQPPMTTPASNSGLAVTQSLSVRAPKSFKNNGRPLSVSLISIFLILSSLWGLVLTWAGFLSLERERSNLYIKNYEAFKYLTLITVAVVAYRYIRVASTLWESRNIEVPSKQSGSLVATFAASIILNISYQLTFIGFDFDIFIAGIFPFIISGLVVVAIYFYLGRSSAVSDYFSLDVGPHLLTLRPVPGNDQSIDGGGEIDMQVRQQIKNLSYKSESDRNVPIFFFNDDVVGIFRFDKLFIFRNKNLAENAINREYSGKPVDLSDVTCVIPCNLSAS
jgi:hypothetical protein